MFLRSDQILFLGKLRFFFYLINFTIAIFNIFSSKLTIIWWWIWLSIIFLIKGKLFFVSGIFFYYLIIIILRKFYNLLIYKTIDWLFLLCFLNLLGSVIWLKVSLIIIFRREEVSLGCYLIWFINTSNRSSIIYFCWLTWSKG